MKRERNKKPVEETKEKTQDELIQEQLTWRGEACKTLDLLEKQMGVNIYEPNRFGGMYIKQKNGKTLAEEKKLSSIFKNEQQINTENHQYDEKQLASFFKS